LVDQQKGRVIEMLCRDMHSVYGERILLKQLAGLLWFGTDSSLQWGIKGQLPLTLHSDPNNGERYVLTDELVNLLVARYQRAVSGDVN